MRKLILISAVSTMTVMADSWTGSLVDVMCKGKDLTSHTKSCNVSCAAGGYGLVLADGKFIKFNEGGGNNKAFARKWPQLPWAPLFEAKDVFKVEFSVFSHLRFNLLVRGRDAAAS